MCAAVCTQPMPESDCEYLRSTDAPAGVTACRIIRLRAYRPSWGRRRPSPKCARWSASPGLLLTMPAAPHAPHCALMLGKPCACSRTKAVANPYTAVATHQWVQRARVDPVEKIHDRKLEGQSVSCFQATAHEVWHLHVLCGSPCVNDIVGGGIVGLPAGPQQPRHRRKEDARSHWPGSGKHSQLASAADLRSEYLADLSGALLGQRCILPAHHSALICMKPHPNHSRCSETGGCRRAPSGSRWHARRMPWQACVRAAADAAPQCSRPLLQCRIWPVQLPPAYSDRPVVCLPLSVLAGCRHC